MLTILVTGAAGLIGGEVCARLVRQGHRVFALMHRSPDVLGNDGQSVPVAGALHGDVRAEGLGVAQPPAIDVIVHCAASLSFDAPYESLSAINIEGTRNVVALARRQQAALLHVSTAYVCGLNDGPVPEQPVAPGTRFANGYERSKAEAEAVIRESALPHMIARPAIVLGDSQTGAIRKFDAMYQFFALFARGLVTHLPALPQASLDFVPVDHVCEAIACLAQAMDKADGAICHLTSTNPLPVDEFAEAIASYPQFRAPRLVDAAQFDPQMLAPAQRRVWSKVAGAYASYFQRNPRFEDATLRKLTGLSAPVTGAPWFHRLISFAIAGGLLPGTDPNAHQGKGRRAVPAHQTPTASLP